MIVPILDRQPPCNLEAEAGVLGSVLLNPDAFDEVASVVNAADFYDYANQILFRHIAEMREIGLRIDMTLLVDHLKSASDYERVGGRSYLARTFQSVANCAHAVYYAHIVREKSRWRQAIDLYAEKLAEAYAADGDIGAALADAESRISDLADRSPLAGNLADGQALADVALDDMERRKAGTNNLFATGISDLDAMLGGGFEPGEFVVIGARTSRGKTAFAVNILARATIGRREPAALFSIEMTRREIVQRIITSEGWLNSLDVLNGTLNDDDQAKFLDVARRIRTAPIWVDDSHVHSIGTFSCAARRIKRRHDVKAIMLDYVQLLEPAAKSYSRERELADISRRLKALAKELQLPIIVLAQLNKDADKKEPTVKHLRECEAIGHEANKLLLLHRPDAKKVLPAGEGEEITIIVDKQRSGPTGPVKLLWFRDSMRIESPAREHITVFDKWNAGRG